ncbi:MAG: STAS domain-containing protein [Armatimonadota bacterium]|nr:STAS domain-containing protein [Armatimonadota bacterium]
MNLQISDREWGERGVTLVLKGEIDIYSAAQIRQKVLDVVECGRVLIVANLQEVNYLDSTGLAVLIGALRRAREHDGDLVIVSSHPRLNKIFGITGLGKIFRIVAEEEIAVRAMTGNSLMSEEMV